jgi:hypothetical protein
MEGKVIHCHAVTSRFWPKVEIWGNDKCWPWLAALVGGPRGGYGKISIRGITYRAHTVAWEIYHGRRVPRGFVVRHSCDNRRCCNPHHLTIGKQVENMKDLSSRERWANQHGKGANHVTYR